MGIMWVQAPAADRRMRGRQRFGREALGKTATTVHLPRALPKVRVGTGAFASTPPRKRLPMTRNVPAGGLVKDKGFDDRRALSRRRSGSGSGAHRLLRGILQLRAFLSLGNRRLDPIVPVFP